MNSPSKPRGLELAGIEFGAALSAEEPGRSRAALIAYAAVVAAAAVLSGGLGLLAYGVQSARVATLLTTVIGTFASGFGAAIVPDLLRMFGKAAAGAQSSAGRAAPNTIRSRFIWAVVFAGAADGLVATTATLQSQAGPIASVLAGLVSALLLLLPLALLLLPCWLVVTRPKASIVARHLRAALSGGVPEAEGLALFIVALLVAGGVSATWWVGRFLAERQIVEVAILETAAIASAVPPIGAIVVAAVLPAVGGDLAKRLSAAAPPWLPFAAMAQASVGVAALYALLPEAQAVTPAAGVVGFALGRELSAPLPKAWGYVSSVVVMAIAFMASGGTLTLFDSLPDVVRTGVVGRAPYAGLVLGAVHRRPGRAPTRRIAAAYKPPVQVPARDLTAKPLRENVIMIHVEALRPDHVGFIGYKRPTTPHIDKFREGATWFKNAYSLAPTTRFALSMLFTGWDIQRIPQARGHAVDFTLLPEAVTIPERLEPLGYDRVGYTLTYVIEHIKGLGQGFRTWETPWPLHEWEASYQNSAEQTTDAALKYLATVPADGSKPYLLFLHYMATHDPYIKHSPWNYGDELKDKYDSAMNYQDEQIGRLLDAIDARADRGNTAILLYSDHGELFGEHGYNRHGFTLYQPDVHCLLLVRVPGEHVATVETPMLLEDLSPTIEELTGLPADREIQSWDLLPYIKGAPMAPRPLFLYSDQWRQGVHYVSRGILDVDGHTKLIRNVSVGSDELYDIATDPEELHNLAAARPKDVARLGDQIAAWEAFENPDNRSYETSNHEVKEKQQKMQLPSFPSQ